MTAILRDPRDRALVIVLLQAYAFVLAGAVLFFAVDVGGPVLPLVYLLVFALVFLGPVTNVLHNMAHRRLFVRRARWIEPVIETTLLPFFGLNAFAYRAHHIAMHHPENNLEADVSSTMGFQRDRLGDFLRYCIRFHLLGAVDLARYLQRTKRTKLMKSIVASEAFGASVAVLAVCSDVGGGLTMVVLPILLTRSLLMAGNWAQHAYVDAADPADPYNNAVTNLDTRYNRVCFNDGFHTLHHQRPTLHWSSFPEAFEADRETYRTKKAVVFRGLDCFQIWVLLMLRRHDVLARHYAFPDIFEHDLARIRGHLVARTQRIA